MNAEPTEFESPSAGVGIETPGQQCPPNEETLETERTNADGYLLVGMGSNQGEDTSPRTRWYASPYNNDDNICSIEHPFPAAGPQTQRQDTQRKEQTIRPRRERREAIALERG